MKYHVANKLEITMLDITGNQALLEKGGHYE
jgi:hypothetical protein